MKSFFSTAIIGIASYLCLLSIGSVLRTSENPTPQVGELLIVDGDTLHMDGVLPLADKVSGDTLNAIFGPPCETRSTACIRGLQGLWEISEGKFYFRDMYRCCDSDSQASERKLRRLLPDLYQDGRAWARWYSGKLPVPIGDVIYYRHTPRGPVTEKEVVFKIDSGHLVGRDTISNVPTRDPSFPGGRDSLNALFYRLLDWKNIPPSDSAYRMVLNLRIDTSGKAHLKQIFRAPDNPAVEKELKRVLELMPKWKVGYRRGDKKELHYPIFLPITDSLRREYDQ